MGEESNQWYRKCGNHSGYFILCIVFQKIYMSWDPGEENMEVERTEEPEAKLDTSIRRLLEKGYWRDWSEENTFLAYRTFPGK